MHFAGLLQLEKDGIIINFRNIKIIEGMPKQKLSHQTKSNAFIQSMKGLKRIQQPSQSTKLQKSHQYFPTPFKYMLSCKTPQIKQQKSKSTKSKNFITLLKKEKQKGIVKKLSAGKLSTDDGYRSIQRKSKRSDHNIKSISLQINSFVGTGSKTLFRNQSPRTSFCQIYEKVSEVLQEYNDRVMNLEQQNKSLRLYIRNIHKQLQI